MLMILTLLLIFPVRGGNTVCIKLAQKGRVSTIPQSIAYITIYTVLQAILLWAAPPYTIAPPDLKFLIFPTGYALFYFIGHILLLKSLQLGPAAITNTIGQFHCLVPVMFSIFYWGEKLTVFQIIGLVLFIIGLIIYNGSSVSIGDKKQKISAKFLAYSVLSMLTIGCAVIFTKLGMATYPGYGKQYMLYYGLSASVIGIAVTLFSARREVKPLVVDKKFMLYTFIAALAINITNTIFVTYINNFPAAVFLPSVSILSMLGILVLSRVILKEKISKSALVSSILCIIAILCLNIKL